MAAGGPIAHADPPHHISPLLAQPAMLQQLCCDAAKVYLQYCRTWSSTHIASNCLLPDLHLLSETCISPQSLKFYRTVHGWSMKKSEKTYLPQLADIGACCSIRRNICYGLEAEDGVASGEVPTTSDIEEAARLANAHDFIMALPQGYETVSPPCFCKKILQTAGVASLYKSVLHLLLSKYSCEQMSDQVCTDCINRECPVEKPTKAHCSVFLASCRIVVTKAWHCQGDRSSG